jgi:imidazole glycerol phosphate synthase subunit HisF
LDCTEWVSECSLRRAGALFLTIHSADSVWQNFDLNRLIPIQIVEIDLIP